MPICVLVMGGPRAGTSLCSGILHRLGIPMGEDLGGEDFVWNPTGFHEDGEFADIYSRMCCGDGTGSMEAYMPADISLTGDLLEWHSRAIRKRCDSEKSWGVKSARLCYVLTEFIAACTMPVKVIRMVRPESEMIASWQTRSGVSVEAAQQTIHNAVGAADAAIEECKPDLLRVQYHDLIDKLDTEIGQIAAFIGCSINAESRLLVDPLLRRFRHG